MKKNFKIDNAPVEKSKKYLWAYLKNTIMLKKTRRIFSFFTPFKISLGFATALLLIFAIILNQNFSFLKIPSISNPNTVFANFEMQALNEDSAGISPDSEFLLKSSEEISVNFLKENLKKNFDQEIEIEKIEDNEFLIKAKEPLNSNTIVNFRISSAIENFSFSYQVKNDFKIFSTIPDNFASYVPLNTGIEIKFNNENFDFENIKNFFEISPKTEGRFEKHARSLVFIPSDKLKENTIYTVKIKSGIKIINSDLKLNEDKVFSFETSGEESDYYSEYVKFVENTIEILPNTDPVFPVYLGHLKDDRDIEVNFYKFENEKDFLKAFKDIKEIPNWSYYYRNVFRHDTKNLKNIATLTAKIYKNNYQNYLFVPDFPLEKGFYLMEVLDDEKNQVLIQSSELSAMAYLSLSDSFIWVNNLITKTGSEKAKIKFLENSKEAFTDASGFYKFKTPENYKTLNNEDYFYYEISDDLDNKIYLGVNPSSAENKSFEYNVSANTDKSLYLANDKVNIWGFINQKNNKSVDKLNVKVFYNYFSLFDSFELSTSDGFFQGEYLLKNSPVGYYYLEFYDGDDFVLRKNFEVKNYVKPAYQITIEAEKRNYFVGEKIKYFINASYFDGTPLSYSELEYKFNFDESTKKKLFLDENGNATIEQLATLSNDNFDNYFHIKSSNFIEVYSPKAEATNISENETSTIFVANVYLETKTSHKDGIAKIETKASNVDINNAEKSEDIYDYYSFIGAGVSGQKISGKITKVVFEKVKKGERYDFINKVVVDEYELNRKEIPFDNFSMTTDNSGNASYEFKIEKDGFYEIELTSFDKNGAITKSSNTLYGNFNPYEDYSYLHLKFLKQGDLVENVSFDLNEKIEVEVFNNNSSIEQSTGKFIFLESLNGLMNYSFSDNSTYSTVFSEKHLPSFYISAFWFDGKKIHQIYPQMVNYNTTNKTLKVETKADKESYLPGEEVNLSFKVLDHNNKGSFAVLNVNIIDEAYYKIAYDNNSNPLTDIYNNVTVGSLDLSASHLGMEDQLLKSEAGLGGCFTEDTLIKMADLSDKRISEINVGDIILTRESPYSKKLVGAKVVNTMKEYVGTYLIINDFLEITGEHIVYSNGEFKEAKNLLIGDDLTDINGRLITVQSIQTVVKNSWVYNFEVEGFHTYFANGIYVHNDKGGGIRTDFRDSALFKLIKTDSSGNAKVSFKLPDNISSFRVSTSAVNLKNLSAGIGSSEIIVSKPLFVDAVLNKQYSIKDKAEIIVRTFGSALEKNEDIKYEISSTKEGFLNKETFDGKSFSSSYFKIPEFKEKGVYDLIIKSSNNNHSDAVKYNFEVVSSRLKRYISEIHTDLSSSTEIFRSNDGITEIRLIDDFNDTLYKELITLYGSDGARIDQIVLKKMASDILEKYFGENFYFNEEIDLFIYQDDNDGGLSLLPYSSSDLELSAMMAIMGNKTDNYFSSYLLSEYFYSFLDDKDANFEEYILALTGLSGLNEPVLKTLKDLSNEKDLKFREQTLLGLSLAKLGDKNSALSLYNKIKNNSKINDYDKALFAIFSAYVGDDEYKNIWRNVEVKGIEDEILNIFRLGLVNFGIENNTKTEGKVEIAFNGVSQVFEFKNGNFNHSLYLAPNDKIEIKSVNGNISLISFFEKEIDSKTFLKDEDIQITRKYYVDNKETNTFKEGDLVKIEIYLKLNKDFIFNGFEVRDIVPSGLYPITQSLFGIPYLPYGFDSKIIYPFNIDGQVVKFSLGFNPHNFEENKREFKTHYFARVVNTGTFYAEPVSVRSWHDPNIQTISKEDFVEIIKR